MTATALLETKGLTMRFGGVVAVDHVDFTLQEVELRCVIGPNGAGKSTLLQVLAGIITPSAGVVEVDGRISSLLTLGAGFDQELSGTDNIRLAASSFHFAE